MENSCRECRKFGEKLFLKGDRCLSPKCAITRRANLPGTAPSRGGTVHRRKKSEYGTQLFEKQKAKSEYGLRERQFSLLVEKASKTSGATGEIILQTLERRLDNVVYRLGWANSRAFARQLVNHGHIKVNHKIIDIPSYSTKIKDIIEPENIDFIEKIASKKANIPNWLNYKSKNFQAEINRLPLRDDIDTPINEQLIVEFYSR